MDLPVFETLPALRAALAEHPLVILQAPPGAGKSTGLPLALLNEPWLAGRKVLLLQPRRVAARAVAARLAESLGEAVGETVGYRVRFESRVGPRTRLEVITEGILTRDLQRDPELPGVGLVMFDEFHERSVQADVAYTLTREVQGALRDDLRALVMSATLAPDLPARLDARAPLIVSEGRAYPVEVRYAAADAQPPVAGAVSATVRRALADTDGDVLAFLPGVADIRAAQALLGDVGPGVRVLPLYGDLPLEEQRRALLPDLEGLRRVVLATNIAETSVTLPNVRAVVDGGFSRRAQFDPGSGLTRLVTARVTRDAADQRAGRAGRVAPGVAYRLWTARTQPLLGAARAPEIMDADLAGVLLDLAQWGVTDPAALAWPDAPPARHWAAARALLTELGALDDGGRLTPHGARLLTFPTHPRLAHLLAVAAERGLGALAADVAALLEERDPFPRGSGADLTARVDALRAHRGGRRTPGDRGVLARAEQLARQWRRALGAAQDDRPADAFTVGLLVALAYPERVAGARASGAGRYVLAGGRGARLADGDSLLGEPFLAVAHLDARDADGTVHLAAPLPLAALEARSVPVDIVRWDERTGALLAHRAWQVGAVTLREERLEKLAPEARAAAVAQGLRAAGLGALPWSDAAVQLRARVASLRAWRPDLDLPDLGDAALLGTLDVWLTPHLGGVRTRDDLGRLDTFTLLQALVPWDAARTLDDLTPTHLTVPSGSRVRLTYHPDGAAPVLAVKLQELFGLADTPAVNAGRTPVLLHLLSPAGRPVQVTQDLRSFWQGGYFEVRKDLRGRYPKHPWPDDPWTATPTKHTKKRLEREGNG
ncbi:ATP-dependent helicase HrpB [Deinococcus maricopensis]|uniref:ATP-dependent helicase HrpB n=1 Tax=Deinococcus maricopensis (strain DSM 21211 / LMG 22137 / NRRL B-23946 / LB-34) TaxID=709986 RepID=E8U5L1_DEIML|nr:ATP-dependent helicase HrpB [Deinococcus maricopensis]ADV66350.1 ATP-dependent helicase HrpB [Deinococcus maricopensis DSM 21211]